MYRRKTSIITLALLICSFSLWAQSLSTFSPYSRYGLGEIRTQGYANTKAMGGISQGVRNGTWVNYLNPASYTAQDSMSFIFDFGVEGGLVNYRSGDQSNLNSVGNLHHLAIQFPAGKYVGVSAGIQPYSHVGYKIKHVEMDPYLLSSIGPIKYYHNGNGGLTQMFLGAAFQPIKSLSLGANFNYFFGAMEHKSLTQFPEDKPYVDIEEFKSIIVRDVAFDFGVQYSLFMGKEDDYRLVLGGSFNNHTSLNAKQERFIAHAFDNILDTISFNSTSTSGLIGLPLSYMGGFTLSYKERFLLGADVSYQEWDKESALDANAVLSNSLSIRMGMEYTPNPMDLRSYYKRISYRAGVYHNSTALKLRDSQLDDYGITFGLGLPIKRTRTSFNISVELGTKGTLKNDLVKENYGMLNFGFTFYDFWFYKYKYD